MQKYLTQWAHMSRFISVSVGCLYFCLKSRCQQGHGPSETWRWESFLTPSWLSWFVGSVWCSLTYIFSTSIPAFILMQSSLVCQYLTSSYKDPSHVELGHTLSNSVWHHPSLITSEKSFSFQIRSETRSLRLGIWYSFCGGEGRGAI